MKTQEEIERKKAWKVALMFYVKLLVPIAVCSVIAYYIMYFTTELLNFISTKYSFTEQCAEINQLFATSPTNSTANFKNYTKWAYLDKKNLNDLSSIGIYECYCQSLSV